MVPGYDVEAFKLNSQIVTENNLIVRPGPRLGIMIAIPKIGAYPLFQALSFPDINNDIILVF